MMYSIYRDSDWAQLMYSIYRNSGLGTVDVLNIQQINDMLITLVSNRCKK